MDKLNINKRTVAEQSIIQGLVENYHASLGGKEYFLKRSMCIAYEKGVCDALQWVREYNEGKKKEIELGNLNE